MTANRSYSASLDRIGSAGCWDSIRLTAMAWRALFFNLNSLNVTRLMWAPVMCRARRRHYKHELCMHCRLSQGLLRS